MKAFPVCYLRTIDHPGINNKTMMDHHRDYRIVLEEGKKKS